MHGLYLLWWVQERQLPASLVAAIIAAGDLALLGLEIPTGWFADRFGHRASLIAGSFVQVCGMLVCWLGDSVPELIVASILVALGDAFRSGAGEALLYRSCLALGCESQFQRIHARTHAAGIVGLVALVLVGGLVAAQWGFHAGWAAETVLCAIGLAIACAMHEPPPAQRGGIEPAASRAWRSMAKVSPSLVLPAALVGAAASASAFIAQTNGQQQIAGVTFLVAVIALAEAAGSFAAVRVPSAGIRAQVVLLTVSAVVVAGALLVPALFLPAVVVLAFFAGLAEPLRDAAIQRTIADHVRATAASVASACDMAANLLVLPIAGGWHRRRR
jgi:MFS family permease